MNLALEELLDEHDGTAVWLGSFEARPVAVKVRPPGERERVEVEARALAAIGPPHVPALLARTDVDGGPALVLEHVGGVRLDRLPGRARRPRTVAAIGAAAAEVLAGIHTAGWVHGDVTPTNLLVQLPPLPAAPEARHLRFLDLDAATPRGGPVLAATPGFAAPEAATAGRADPASDVHGLARTCRWLLSDPGATPDSRMVLDALASALDADPRRRPDAAALAAALDELTHLLPRPPSVQGAPSRGGPNAGTGGAGPAPEPPTAPIPRTVDFARPRSGDGPDRMPRLGDDRARPLHGAAGGGADPAPVTDADPAPTPRWPLGVAAGAVVGLGATVLTVPPPARWPTLVLQTPAACTALAVAGVHLAPGAGRRRGEGSAAT